MPPYQFDDASPEYFEHMLLAHSPHTDDQWFDYCRAHNIWILFMGQKTALPNPNRTEDMPNLRTTTGPTDNASQDSDSVEGLELIEPPEADLSELFTEMAAPVPQLDPILPIPRPNPNRSPTPSTLSESYVEMEFEDNIDALVVAMDQSRPVAAMPSQLLSDFLASASAWNKGSTGVQHDHPMTGSFGTLFSQGPSTASHVFRWTPSGSCRQRLPSTVGEEIPYPLPANYWVPKVHSSDNPTIQGYTRYGVSHLNSTDAHLNVHTPGLPLAHYPLIVMDARREHFDVENFTDESSYTLASQLLEEDSFLHKAFRDIAAYLLEEVSTLAGIIHLNEEQALSGRRFVPSQ